MNWNPLKYHSVYEVFINNFEALQRHRDCLCVPHRLPAAARYFIWHRMVDSEAVRILDLPEPLGEHGDSLEFEDGSVLVLPDLIFADADTQELMTGQRNIYMEIDAIQQDLDALSKETSPQELIEKAIKLIKFIDYPHSSEYLAFICSRLKTAFFKQLSHAFFHGNYTHLESPAQFRDFARRVNKIPQLKSRDHFRTRVAWWLQTELCHFHSQRMKANA
jgi:hypothetical protein